MGFPWPLLLYKSGFGGCHECVTALGAVTGEARVLDHPDEDQTVLRVDGHISCVSAAVAKLTITHTPAEAILFREVVSSLLAGHLSYGGL